MAEIFMAWNISLKTSFKVHLQRRLLPLDHLLTGLDWTTDYFADGKLNFSSTPATWNSHCLSSQALGFD